VDPPWPGGFVRKEITMTKEPAKPVSREAQAAALIHEATAQLKRALELLRQKQAGQR
jgi:hypothetical protein